MDKLTLVSLMRDSSLSQRIVSLSVNLIRGSPATTLADPSSPAMRTPAKGRYLGHVARDGSGAIYTRLQLREAEHGLSDRSTPDLGNLTTISCR